MFRKFRGRIASVGLAITSLFPNPGKVSFMGARDAAKTVASAIETAAAKTEPIVEKVAQAATTSGGRAAAAGLGGVGVVAGGAALRGCGRAATVVGRDVVEVAPGLGKGAAEVASGLGRPAAEAASGLGKEAEQVSAGIAKGAAEDAGSASGELPKNIGSSSSQAGEPAESLTRPEPPLLKGPGVRPGMLVVPQAPARSVAQSAVESAGLRITGAIGSHPETMIAQQILHEESIRMTESLIMRLGVADLQTPQAVAKAFNAALDPSNMFHAALDTGTGIVRMHMVRNGVVVAAEFNIYSAAGTAATALLRRPGLLDPQHDATPRRPLGA